MSDENPTTTTEPVDDRGADVAAAIDKLSEPAPTTQATETAPAVSRPDGRDQRGRFVPKADAATGSDPSSTVDAPKPSDAAATPSPTTKPPQPGGEPTPRQTPAGDRAPASWRPEAREAWAALPQPVREEVARREREADEAMGQSAGARRFAHEFGRVVSPYQAMIAAEGGDALGAVNSFFQTAALLRTGAPQQKAALVADLIQRFGVPIEALDGILAGQPQQRPGLAPEVEQLLAQRMAPVERLMQSLEQRRAEGEQRLNRDVATELSAFATATDASGKPVNEFFNDVKQDMGELLTAASRRGADMTLAQAYERACAIHPEVGKIVAERKLRAAAAAQAAAATQARRASVGVSGSPRPGRPDDDANRSRRDDVAEAFDRLGA
jgi:hypothetical protein